MKTHTSWRAGRVPVPDCSAIDSVDRRIARLNAYLHREDVSAIEIAENLMELIQHPGVGSQVELARRLNKNEVWISEMLVILRLPEHLKQRVRASELPVPAYALSRIARLDDAAQQERLIEALLKGGSSREILRRIKSLARTPMRATLRRMFSPGGDLRGFRIIVERRARSMPLLGMTHALEAALAVVRAEIAAMNTVLPLARVKSNGQLIVEAKDSAEKNLPVTGVSPVISVQSPESTP